MLYDGLLLVAVWFAATALLLAWRNGEAIPPHHVYYTIYLLGIGFAFFGGFWIHGGQTLGMRAWNIRVLSENGKRIRLSQAALRYIFAWVSLGAVGLGYWWSLLDRRRRCWHDRFSATYVTWDRVKAR